MDYITKSPSLQRLSRSEGKWVGYQLKLRGLTQATVAAYSNKARNTVANVLTGRISSLSVYTALCSLLGYDCIGALLADARRSVK